MPPNFAAANVFGRITRRARTDRGAVCEERTAQSDENCVGCVRERGKSVGGRAKEQSRWTRLRQQGAQIGRRWAAAEVLCARMFAGSNNVGGRWDGMETVQVQVQEAD